MSSENSALHEVSYDYRDENGVLLYQLVRFNKPDGKKGNVRPYFQRPDGKGGWIQNLDGVRRVPYRLPELLAAIAAGERVVLCEGEKPAELLRTMGFCATTTPMGAKGWKPAYAKCFTGADVCAMPDNDKPGLDYVNAAAHDLAPVAKRVCICTEYLKGLPEKGDVEEFLRLHADESLERLLTLINSAPEYNVKPVAMKKSGRRVVRRKGSEIAPEIVEWLLPDYIPRGMVTLIAGLQGCGKSAFAHTLAAAVTRGYAPFGIGAPTEPRKVVILDYEGPTANLTVPRLIRAGADMDYIEFLEVEAGEDVIVPLALRGDLPLIREVLLDTRAALLVIDPVNGGCVGDSAYDPNSSMAVREVMAGLARLSSDTLIATMCLHHLNKRTGDSGISRVAGAMEYTAVPRAAFMAGTPPGCPVEFGLACLKMNPALKPPSAVFRLTQGIVEYLGTSNLTPDDLAGGEVIARERGRPATGREAVLHALKDAGGDVSAEEIAEAAGVGATTVRDVLRAIGYIYSAQTRRWARTGGNINS